MATFGENLRELRKSRGYSQDRFAKLIGSNQMTLSAWEIGTRMPQLSTIKHIAEVFHVPLSSLISLEDTGNEDDFAKVVSDVLNRDPKVRMIFEKIRYMKPSDLDVVLGVINAITRERTDEEESI